MLIDLSHALENGVPSFPGDPAYETIPHATHEKDRLSVTRLAMGSHQGTHLDAPFHFYPEGKKIHQMSLEPFFGPAALVDLAPGGETPPNAELDEEVFAAHAEVFQPGARVIFRTGWEKQFGAKTFFTDFPSMTPAAAEWIAGTGISLLGMDLPTPGKDAWGTHLPLLKPGVEIVIVEALCNLHKLPDTFTLAAFPIKLKGMDGAPVRAIAIVDE
ncbi:MAG: cyclase family protein [Opitutales bacterium]